MTRFKKYSIKRNEKGYAIFIITVNVPSFMKKVTVITIYINDIN